MQSAPTIDHRGIQSHVRNQGNRPTCVPFAVTAAHQWMAADSQILSPEHALWGAKQVDGMPLIEATSVYSTLVAARRLGSVLESDWPYCNPSWPSPPPASVTSCSRLQLGEWRPMENPSIDSIANALRTSAVILTVFFVTEAWLMAASTGIVDLAPPASPVDAHAVLAVGITSGNCTADQSIIFKNSWGVNWGQSGYGYMTQRYVSKYLIAAHRLEAI
jgi:C1A family cysteine protease